MKTKVMPSLILAISSLLAIQGCSSAAPKNDTEAIVQACELYFKGIKENDGGESTILKAIDSAQLAQELSTSGSVMAEYRELEVEMTNTIEFYKSLDPQLIGTMNRAERSCNEYIESN